MLPDSKDIRSVYSNSYIQSPTDFYRELEEALLHIPQYALVYKKFAAVFNNLLEENTANLLINFGGPYPKTDYLLKEKKSDWRTRKRIHDTRVRLRERGRLGVGNLEENCFYDLQSLCLFIELIYGNPIPDALKKRFLPENRHPDRKIHSFDRCARMMVNHWDDDYFYGQLEKWQTKEDIKVAFVGEYGDWSYLKELFDNGCQVNLIKPSWIEEGVEANAEYIIYEPDYLIDVSAIAGCFEQYAESAFINLVKKIKPNIASYATLLGNFASQLLDDSVNHGADNCTYSQSAKDFFRHNALSLSLLGRDESQRFHTDAKSQKHNISMAMHTALPQAVKSDYNPKLGMVEPSFFSEMLGMQGRMDYLQLDFKLLLEQKSGKGQFPYDDFETPRETRQHYIQMLLYMMVVRYNYSHQYEKNGHNLRSYLLYSKYRNSLLNLVWAPQLTYAAIKVRNQLAKCEIFYTLPDSFRLLERITAESLNRNGVDNKLWHNFQKQEIDSLLNKIKSASQLERDYFFRLMTFIAKEHNLSKIGNKTKENSGFASKWLSSFEDKLSSGNIYASLKLDVGYIAEQQPVERVRFLFNETESNDMANFREGDIVVLYPYIKGSEPDVRESIVFRGSIESIDSNSILLYLRSAQSNRYVFEKDIDKLWAIEHDFIESSYAGLYRGMYAFLNAPKERRDLLLFQREPETDIDIKQLKYAGHDNFKELALRVKQAKDIFLIIGPPGTGKTSYGLVTTLVEELAEEGSSVLLMAYTNRAVDEICDKLIGQRLDFIRVGSKLTSSFASRDYLLTEKCRKADNAAQLISAIASTRIFVGTTAALSSSLALFEHKQFSLAIIDEASQILEPQLMPLLSASKNGKPCISKFVMIGDHKQLPAVVQQSPSESVVNEQSLNEISLSDCRLSLFERLLKRYGGNPSVTYMLTKQGRMHPQIALFPNIAFYNNRLEMVPLEHQQRELPCDLDCANQLERIIRTKRVSFIAAGQPADSPSDKINQVEANIIASFVLKIYELDKDGFDADRTVGVIVPYRNQIATVRNAISRFGIEKLTKITIDTVERYQGSQRKYILYGFTIQKYYQLRFLANNVFEDTDGTIVDRKLNVAMTRAEEGLIMVGNPQLLSNNYTFSRLIEFVTARQGYFTAEEIGIGED